MSVLSGLEPQSGFGHNSHIHVMSWLESIGPLTKRRCLERLDCFLHYFFLIGSDLPVTALQAMMPAAKAKGAKAKSMKLKVKKKTKTKKN